MNRFAASKRFFASSSFLAIAMIAAPGTAWAQDQDDDTPITQAADEESDEAIVVTGSRIPRANFDTAQPAVVLGGEQIEQRGYTNLADALEELPAFGVPGSSPVGSGQAGELGSGQNFVNFFGLGDQRTLTLVNGRRFVSSNTASIFGPSAGGPGGQVDFNILPTLLTDRIETVAVGGAPIYGSDAISGTINVILKRDFQGIQLDAQASVTEFGDNTDYRIRGAWGTNFAEGRGNITLSAEYNKTSGLDFTSREDLNAFFLPPADPDSPFGNVYARDRVIPSISEYGIPQVFDQFLILDPATAAAFGGFQVGVTQSGTENGVPLRFDPNGNLVPIQFGAPSGSPLFFDGGDGFRLPLNFVAPLERYVGVALAQYQLTDNVRLFAEGWYAHSKGTTFRNQPEYNAYIFSGGVTGAPSGNLIISLDNPFLSPQARTLIANSIANNPNSEQNLFGVPQDFFYLTRANTDLITGTASSTLETVRGVLGLDGNFRALGRDMRFELVGVYGRSETNGRGRQLVTQNLFNAIDTVRDASGNIVCRPGVVSAPVTISQTCAPLNPFGQQSTQAARDYVTAITTPRGVNEQWVVTASISGTLFDIWGGGVGFAIGYEHRDESTDFDPGVVFSGRPDADPLVDENGDGNPTNDRTPYGQGAVFDPVSGGFDTNEFFAELTVPLIGRDQNIPLIYSLELNGAVRWIDHSLAGADPTYTVGATWQPIRDITFRGNFTRSVRSPAITEYFNPTSPVFTFAADPCDGRFRTDGPNPTVRQANCATAGITDPNFVSNVVDASITGSLSGNTGLVNETADAWTVGAVVRPRFIPNLTIAVDWVDIKVQDAVQSLTGTNIMEACYDSADYPNSISASGTNFCDLFTRNAAGQVTFIRRGFENAAQLEFSGLIAELAYRLDTPFLGATSSINFGVNYLYNNKLTLQVGQGDITTLDNSIGYSRHQFTANATYRNAGFAWQWQAQYIGSALVDPDAGPDTYDFPRNGAIVLFNTSLTYNIDRLRLSMGVDNVFGQKPPFPVPAGGGSVTYYDAFRGRLFRFGAGIRF